MVFKRIGYGSIILLAYSLLISPWIGTRTAPDIFIDLLLTLTPYGSSLSQQSPWIQFLILFLCALVGSGLFIWLAQSREYRKWARYFLLLAGLIGLMQTIILFSQGVRQGVRLSGSVICALGFAGMLVASFKETFVSLPEREQARNRVKSDWEQRLNEARISGKQISFLSGWSHKQLSPDIVRKLVNELRSKDLVIAVKDGLYILLWDTSLKNALAASQKTLVFLKQNGFDDVRFGIACFPEDGEHMHELLDKTDFSLQICRQKTETEVVSYREIVFPSDISALFPVITAQTTEFMVRLNNLWGETQETGQPLSALRFNLESSQVDENDFTHQLSQWLRGKDQVGVLNKGHVLAILVNTGADGCEQLLKKLKDQWLKVQPDYQKIKTAPILNINLEDSFKAFIEELTDFRET